MARKVQIRASSPNRRFDLDWLRVGAFGLLIFYHIGMFYVPWGWHVKSGHAPVTSIELPMKLVNGWRLPLLFFISGVALRHALDQSSAVAMLRRRFLVLFLPLVFGMYVICVPQAWHELTENGHSVGTIAAFYMDYVQWPWASRDDWPVITPTWNHLWFLIYILIYSMVLIGARIGGAGRGDAMLGRLAASPLGLIFLIAAQFMLIGLFWDSVGNAQTVYGDWYNLTASFLSMAFGFYVAKEVVFWDRTKNWRASFFLAALVLSGCLAAAHFYDPLRPSSRVLQIFQGWFVIWALLGWGQVLLARSSYLLRYLSRATFTFYIVHQTAIIMIGVPLARLQLPLGIEVILLTIGTILCCWAAYELVAKRIGWFGIFLGTRNTSAIGIKR